MDNIILAIIMAVIGFALGILINWLSDNLPNEQLLPAWLPDRWTKQPPIRSQVEALVHHLQANQIDLVYVQTGVWQQDGQYQAWDFANEFRALLRDLAPGIKALDWITVESHHEPYLAENHVMLANYVQQSIHERHYDGVHLHWLSESGENFVSLVQAFHELLGQDHILSVTGPHNATNGEAVVRLDDLSIPWNPPNKQPSVLTLPTYPDGSPRAKITWSGLLAFLTGKRSSDTGSKLRWRHPITEVVMAVLFGFIILNWPDNERRFVWMIYLTILILVTIIDLEHRIIITPVILVACILAFILALVAPESDRDFVDYIAGGGLGLGLFLVMFWGGGIFSSVVASARGEELNEVAFGFGDVYVATMCGLMIGWQAFIFAAIITVFLGALGGILFLIAQTLRGGYDAFTPLPYGQYIIIGTIIMMLWRSEIGEFLRGG
ncbi:MAG: hypothetical protein DPW16_02365 [Chloroflexi bacterium]|nr:hypothetical protein [Chloroflexota bacterium]